MTPHLKLPGGSASRFWLLLMSSEVGFRIQTGDLLFTLFFCLDHVMCSQIDRSDDSICGDFDVLSAFVETVPQYKHFSSFLPVNIPQWVQ